MSAKQDGVAPRTASDIEQRYNFRRSFAEVMGVATDARTKAVEAKEAAEKVDTNLTSEEIFNRLTEDGTMQGIYRGDDGQIYLNASYIKSGELLADLLKTGVIKSKDGSVQIDLNSNTVTVTTEIDGLKGKIVMDHEGITGYGYDEGGTEAYYKTLKIDPGGVYGGEEFPTLISSLDSNVGISIYAGKSNTYTILGSPNGPTMINGSTIMLNNKTVSWKDNGDGTYTLIGR